MNDEAHILDDGHGWVTTYRNATNGREVQECRSHGVEDGCGIRKYHEHGSWVIADRAPWVTEDQVRAHAKASAVRS